MFEEEPVRPALPNFMIGQSLDAMSIEEIEKTIARLKAEIARLEAEHAAKVSHKSAADALFSRRS